MSVAGVGLFLGLLRSERNMKCILLLSYDMYPPPLIWHVSSSSHFCLFRSERNMTCILLLSYVLSRSLKERKRPTKALRATSCSALWCDAVYDDVTLCMMMWHCVWWCDTVYDDVTLRMMMWHYVWWCDTTYDDVTLCMMMWHCVWWCDTVSALRATSCSALCCMRELAHELYITSCFAWGLFRP
jgi:hypothetical protein